MTKKQVTKNTGSQKVAGCHQILKIDKTKNIQYFLLKIRYTSKMIKASTITNGLLRNNLNVKLILAKTYKKEITHKKEFFIPSFLNIIHNTEGTKEAKKRPESFIPKILSEKKVKIIKK